MIIEDSERLDAALDGGTAAGEELRALVALAVELRDGLSGRWLSAAERTFLYDKVMSIAQDHATRAIWRRVRLDRRASAVLGGAVVTLAAAAAIGLAVARDRRHQRLTVPA
jgi:hypothetical protein